MLDALALDDPRDDIVLFVLQLRGNDDSDRLADDFVSGVSEQALGTAVPRLDAAVERFADDRVVGRFDDRRKKRLASFGTLLGLPQQFGRALLVGHVPRE